jgi:hypothetical protein
MADNEPTLEVRQFLGLRNTDRPASLPVGALVAATNIDIDDQFGIERRSGYTPVAGLTQVTAAYSTKDEKELYVVDGGILKRVITLSPVVTQALAIDVGPAEVWWCDEGGYVFVSGAINGVIHADTFTPFVDFGDDIDQTLDAEGYTLNRDEADIGTLAPPSDTECVAYMDGSVWLSYHDTLSNQSFLFKSKPFFWSRWDLATDYIAIPGHVLMLASHAEGMIIGTDEGIWAHGAGQMQKLAEYGVIRCPSQEFERAVYFWTERGLCRALPFQNMTEENVSVPPGTRAAMTVSREKGRNTALIVTTGGGEADNAYG